MSQDPRLRVDSIATSARNQIPAPSETSSHPGATRRAIKDISRALAAHGAGATSTELALDLVLHEIAVEARELTQATAAAIAWMRDGEMVCRASTGHNPPDLGTRVDIRSGIAGACVNTRGVQVWRSTKMDSAQSGEGLQQLGVSSILCAPIADGGVIFGILELFSSNPEAFGETECTAIRPFVARCIEAMMEAQDSSKVPPEDLARTEIVAAHDDGTPSQRSVEPDVRSATNRPFPSSMKELSNSMLLVAVLAVAIVFGLVVGWRRGMGKNAPSLEATPNTPIATARDSDGAAQPSPGTTSNAPTTATRVQSAGASAAVTPGGLLILEDGKVVYRASVQSDSAPRSSLPVQASGLLHRVNPEYPPQALAQHVQGPVVLDVKVLGDGSVGDVVVRSGDPLLTEAAMDAVKQWRFAPHPEPSIERDTRVTIKFSLPAQ